MVELSSSASWSARSGPLYQRSIPVFAAFVSTTLVFSSPLPYSVAKFGDVLVIKNKYALPFGYTYDTYLKESDFIGIIPGSFDNGDVIEFQKEYMPSFKLVKDSSLRLTNYLKGEVTPEVVVINIKTGALIYKGAIDDWVVSLGKTRNRISNFYLDVAIHNFLNDKYSIEMDFKKLFKKISKNHLQYYEISDINLDGEIIASWKKIRVE